MSLPQTGDDRLESRAQALLAQFPEPGGALHPLIDLLLAEGSPWDAAAAARVARWTGLPVAHVDGAASSRTPAAGPEVVHVCTGLSCGWMGADAVCARLAALAGVEVVEADCLGACSAAPVLVRHGRLYDGLTAARLEAVVAGDR